MTTQLSPSKNELTKIFQIVPSDGKQLINICAKTDSSSTNKTFDVYVFTASHNNVASFTKGLESNATFSVERAETFDGSSYLTLMHNNFIKARITSERSFRIFSAVPEERGYSVDYELESKLIISGFLRDKRCRTLLNLPNAPFF